MVTDNQAELLFGSSEVFVAAKTALEYAWAHQQPADFDVTYFHILLTTHELVLVEAMCAESLFLGDMPDRVTRVRQNLGNPRWVRHEKSNAQRHCTPYFTQARNTFAYVPLARSHRPSCSATGSERSVLRRGITSPNSSPIFARRTGIPCVQQVSFPASVQILCESIPLPTATA